MNGSSPHLATILMLKPKDKGERGKAEEGGQWGDVTGGRDPSLPQAPAWLPGFHHCQAESAGWTAVVTECQLTHPRTRPARSKPATTSARHLLANARLPVRTTNKISKQLAGPSRRAPPLLSYCKGRDHVRPDAPRARRALPHRPRRAKVASRERQAGGTRESRKSRSAFIRPSILPFLHSRLHSFLSSYSFRTLWRHAMGVRGSCQQTHSPSENLSSRTTPLQ